MNSTRRIATVVTSCATALAAAIGLAQPANALEPNTVRSSTGAYLQSAGVCGGAWRFSIRSTGFEYLRLTVRTSAGTGSTVWWPVSQDYRYTYELPYRYQGMVYVIHGADWVNGAWEVRSVTTSFDRIMAGDNYATSYC